MTLYLSCLALDVRHNRTKSEVERPYELHRSLCKAWDDREAARILFRAEQERDVVQVIVQSLTAPDWSRLAAPPCYLRGILGPKEIRLDAIHDEQELAFRLRCRPTKRVYTGTGVDGPRKSLTTKEEILRWLHRKADDNGFSIREAAFDRVYWRDTKAGNGDLVGAVQFEGILVVTDGERIRAAIRDGVGTQKAFGFGLLSVARM